MVGRLRIKACGWKGKKVGKIRDHSWGDSTGFIWSIFSANPMLWDQSPAFNLSKTLFVGFKPISNVGASTYLHISAYIDFMKQRIVMLSEMLKPLGDPLRLSLLNYLADGEEHCVCEMAESLSEPEFNISRKLAPLRKLGLHYCPKQRELAIRPCVFSLI